jgi:hypothetical protein
MDNLRQRAAFIEQEEARRSGTEQALPQIHRSDSEEFAINTCRDLQDSISQLKATVWRGKIVPPARSRATLHPSIWRDEAA